MENMQNSAAGQRLYVLSEQAYEELKDVQEMLSILAHITESSGDPRKGTSMLTVPQFALSSFFSRVSAQMGDALAQLSYENELGGKRPQ